MNQYFYADNIVDFVSRTENEILGILTKGNPPKDFQRNAWLFEFHLLQNILSGQTNGQIIFEYIIPRLGKRIDVVLLLHGIVFVLEFKVGAERYEAQDKRQCWNYALDLKCFHEASHNLTLAPILVATDAPNSLENTIFYRNADRIIEPVLCNAENLDQVIEKIVTMYATNIDLSNWKDSRYMPTPTIIEAAIELYNNHSVENITRTDADAEKLKKTTEFVKKVITSSCNKSSPQKSICFVTGVPGAGKTLIGLDVAVSQTAEHKAVYLSGNQSLVWVLSEALAKDKQKNNPSITIDDARADIAPIIQIVHHYRDTSINKIKVPIENNELEIKQEIKGKSNFGDGYAEVEHVAIFDEAQRAWTKKKLASWLAEKKIDITDFPMSEPEFLIWSMNLRKDWAVIICLVGEGQEIKDGEAGIGEWLRAIKNKFPNWNVFISDYLSRDGYAEKDVAALLTEMQQEGISINTSKDLHLTTSMRSLRAEQLSNMVHYLLINNIEETSRIFRKIKDKYPIFITRSLDKAKDWIRNQKTDSQRYGLLASSKAKRLSPFAINVDGKKSKSDIINWFLSDDTDIRSSQFLEVAASEFDVQGLELDWGCLIWDCDLRIEDGKWKNYQFKGTKWYRINNLVEKSYQINAYRVLLTRARQGMVLCVPEGNSEDFTRLPEFYDGTFEYLKSIGIPELS